MQTEVELCQTLKGRINTLNEWHAKYLNTFKIVNEEHPDYIPQPVDINTINEKLGPVPNDIERLKIYLKNATDIYLKSMDVYETLKENHEDYITEKRFLYEC